MQSKLTHKSPTRISAEVEVPWKLAAPHYEKSLKEIRAHAQLPGFRKGKAPAVMLKRKFRDEITNALIRNLVPESITELVKENDLKLVGTPQLNSAEIKENQSFNYVAELDVLPEFELNDWKGMQVESLRVDIDENAVDHELEHVRDHAATNVPVEGRPVQEGDVVHADVTAIDLAAGESLLNVERYELRTGDENCHPVLKKMAIGLEQNDFEEETFTAADDDPFVSWRGKEVKVFMEVSEISTRSVPELNDELAAQHDFDSLDALKDDIRAKLKQRAQDQERDRMVATVLGDIANQYDFEVPEALILEEAQNQVSQQLQPLAQMLKEHPLDKNTIRGLIEAQKPQAEQVARLEIILNKIADQEGIEISDEAIDEEIGKYIEEGSGHTVETLRAQIESEDRMDGIRYNMRRRQVIDQIIDSAEVKEVDTLSSDETEDAGETQPEEEAAKPKKATKSKKESKPKAKPQAKPKAKPKTKPKAKSAPKTAKPEGENVTAKKPSTRKKSATTAKKDNPESGEAKKPAKKRTTPKAKKKTEDK